jgi:hypothetical protein
VGATLCNDTPARAENKSNNASKTPQQHKESSWCARKVFVEFRLFITFTVKENAAQTFLEKQGPAIAWSIPLVNIPALQPVWVSTISSLC